MTNNSNVVFCAYNQDKHDTCLNIDDWSSGFSLIRAKVYVHNKDNPP